MRKNTARHWLHAGLDLLPLILIPVFMIYSHRHTIDSGSIDVPVNKVVDFNQRLTNGDFKNSGNFNAYNYTEFTTLNINNNCETVIISNTANWFYQYGTYRQIDDNAIIGHKYVAIQHVSSSKFTTYGSDTFGSGASYTLLDTNIYGLYWDCTAVTRNVFLYPITNQASDIEVDDSYTIYSTYVTDLTQMFGGGNEPTLQEFYAWYPNNYYDYTLSHKELLKGYSTQTYNDTDIMSQFTYQLYNSVDKYFNMGNVFNLGGVYDWFNLNIFAGNAPIAVYIVWQVVLYEFVMDLLFLLYGLFMWFIDMCKHLMEKPFRSIK